MNLLDLKSVTIPAGTAANPGRVVYAIPGEQFLCWTASAPFQVQFDNQDPCTIVAGWTIPRAWTQLTFLNPNAYPINLSYFYGSDEVSFSGLIQSQELDTYAFGNLGLAASGNYKGGGITQAITIDANGYIKLNAGATIKVFGSNNGNKRKTIVFSVGITSTNPLAPDTYYLTVNDFSGVAGNNFVRVGPGQIIALETSSNFIIQAVGGNVPFNIGELYYQS